MIDKDMKYSPKKRRPTFTPKQKSNNIKDVGYLSIVQEGLAKNMHFRQNDEIQGVETS
jgi:hypothetical protein